MRLARLTSVMVSGMVALCGCSRQTATVRNPPPVPALSLEPGANTERRILADQLHQFAVEDAHAVRRR
jgi:uncharacterized lipoprotein YajG